MSSGRFLHLAMVGGRGWLGRAIARAALHRGLGLTVVSRWPGPGVVAVDPEDPTSLTRALAGADVVVNASGYRGDDAARAVATNFTLPDTLAQLAGAEGWRLVHVGSAAEYGPVAPDDSSGPIDESRTCLPTTLYGVTKLAGSQAVLRQHDHGTDAVVARVFNLAAADLPDDNPLHGIVVQLRQLQRQSRNRDGSADHLAGEICIGDPTTVRDISRRSWAAAAIVALATAPASVFGSGTDRPRLPDDPAGAGDNGGKAAVASIVRRSTTAGQGAAMAAALGPVVNVCSGRDVSFGEMARAMARYLGILVSIRDLGWPRGGRVVGDPTRLCTLLDRIDAESGRRSEQNRHRPWVNRPEDLARSILGPATTGWSAPAMAGQAR